MRPKPRADIGLEPDPGRGHPVLLGRQFILRERPVRRLGLVELVPQHVLDLILALDGLQVPCEGHEIAPVAVVLKHLARLGDVALRQRRSELIEKCLSLFGNRCVQHVFLPLVVPRSLISVAPPVLEGGNKWEFDTRVPARTLVLMPSRRSCEDPCSSSVRHGTDPSARTSAAMTETFDLAPFAGQPPAIPTEGGGRVPRDDRPDKTGMPIMTKRFLRALPAATLLAASALPALAAEWDMPTPYGDSVFHTQNIQQFAEDVSSATDGEVEITVHSAGSLFAHPEIKDSVRRGLAPIGEVLMSRLANEHPVFGVDSIPFLASSYDQARTLWEASRPLVEEKLAEQGLTLLFAVPWPGQSIYTQEPVESTADLEGASFRAYNAATERLAQLMGAVPTQIETGDIPTAFSTGRVDAMITSPSTGVSSQAWDFTSNYTDTQAWLPKNMVIVNTGAFDGLPEEQKTAIMDAAAEAETRGWEMSQAETQEQMATLEENGMTIAEPSETLSQELSEIGETMTQEWLDEAGEEGQSVIDAYNSGS